MIYPDLWRMEIDIALLQIITTVYQTLVECIAETELVLSLIVSYYLHFLLIMVEWSVLMGLAPLLRTEVLLISAT